MPIFSFIFVPHSVVRSFCFIFVFPLSLPPHTSLHQLHIATSTHATSSPGQLIRHPPPRSPAGPFQVSGQFPAPELPRHPNPTPQTLLLHPRHPAPSFYTSATVWATVFLHSGGQRYHHHISFCFQPQAVIFPYFWFSILCSLRNYHTHKAFIFSR